MVCITNGQLEALGRVLSVIGQTKDPVPRWEIALRLKLLKPYLEALADSKTAPEDVQELKRLRKNILDTHGSLMGEAQGISRYSVPEDKRSIVSKEVLELEIKHSDLVAKETEYETGVKALLEERVEIDIDPILHSWCGTMVNSHDLVFLMDLDLIVEDAVKSKEKSTR